MLSCKEATRLISESLEHALPFHKRMALRFHLMMCRFCARFEKQIIFLREVFKRYGKQEQAEDTISADSPCLSPEAHERMKRRIEQDNV